MRGEGGGMGRVRSKREREGEEEGKMREENGRKWEGRKGKG